MYVDETGADDTTDTTADEQGHDVLTVEVGGEEYEVSENYDYDGDGDNDAAVVQTEDGYMAFSDSDGDGNADTVVELDSEGNVTSAAEYDESTGEWTEAEPGSVANPSGDGADDSGSSAPTATDDSADADAAPASTGGGGEILVDTPEGDMTAGTAEYDSDGDGVNDTAVVTDESGSTYAFTDTDGDGSADQAVVIEADGDVTVAQHTGDDEWTTVETGHIGADGGYEADGTGSTGGDTAGGEQSAGASTGSDAAWQS
ncbi:hypothetical protein L6E12_12820 [Actinokineospora sp. PR83]|uniref:DUF6802 family protein n=1 Tax=Actinokineospora sp. PR83 TaxID=2884908 RepID=UPI001F174043|nr:DUF6802 family protein [Actinokineospora sp. PR83]MCG8916674.1 hypothetical protein [Actinokineospora sp. PR83]